MVPQNVLQRVFHIQVGEETGTCFVIDVNNKQYFVTAKHVIENYVKYGGIQIMRDDKWIPLTIQYLGFSPNADVAVFTIPEIIIDTTPLPIDITVGEYFASQDVYFLGFPWRSYTDIGAHNNYYPLPYIKKAIISAFDYPEKNDKSKSIIFLDGHNNEGFSGAPVATSSMHDTTKKVANRIIGIVSSYRVVNRNIHDSDTNESLNNLQYKENIGIITSYSIKYALEVIEQISERLVTLGTSDKV